MNRRFAASSSLKARKWLCGRFSPRPDGHTSVRSQETRSVSAGFPLPLSDCQTAAADRGRMAIPMPSDDSGEMCPPSEISVVGNLKRPVRAGREGNERSRTAADAISTR